MITQFGLIELGRNLESSLERTLQLRPIGIPSDLQALGGTWKGEPASLRARAYRAPGIAYARSVEVASASGMEIANFLMLPDSSFTLPVLGVDLVGLGNGQGLAVADLSTMAENPDDVHLERSLVADVLERMPPLPSAGELPAWARAWPSPMPLFSRITPQDHQAVDQWLAGFVDAFLLLFDTRIGRRAQDGAVAARQREYCLAHIADDRGLQMLTRMFEPGIARRFLTEVMFPSDVPSWT